MRYACDRYAMPASSVASMATMAVSVRRAVRTAGAEKTGTPLLTASTPVIAVHPLANARSRSHRLTAVVAAGAGGATTGVGLPPLNTVLIRPIAMTEKRDSRN